MPRWDGAVPTSCTKPSAISLRTALVMVARVSPVASASSTRLRVVRSRRMSRIRATVGRRVSEPNALNAASWWDVP